MQSYKSGKASLMNTTKTIQDQILKLKKEHDICILAHAYQSQDIWEIADYVGDSYGLSQQAAKSHQKTVLLCGVKGFVRGYAGGSQGGQGIQDAE